MFIENVAQPPKIEKNQNETTAGIDSRMIFELPHTKERVKKVDISNPENLKIYNILIQKIINNLENVYTRLQTKPIEDELELLQKNTSLHQIELPSGSYIYFLDIVSFEIRTTKYPGSLDYIGVGSYGSSIDFYFTSDSSNRELRSVIGINTLISDLSDLRMYADPKNGEPLKLVKNLSAIIDNQVISTDEKIVQVLIEAYFNGGLNHSFGYLGDPGNMTKEGKKELENQVRGFVEFYKLDDSVLSKVKEQLGIMLKGKRMIKVGNYYIIAPDEAKIREATNFKSNNDNPSKIVI